MLYCTSVGYFCHKCAEDPETKTYTMRASIWSPFTDEVDWSWQPWRCQGKWVRQICIFGVGDLPWLYRRPELFVNKFHADFEWLNYDCVEELVWNRTVDFKTEPFDKSYYLNLPFVSNKSLVTSLQETVRHIRRLKASSFGN